MIQCDLIRTTSSILERMSVDSFCQRGSFTTVQNAFMKLYSCVVEIKMKAVYENGCGLSMGTGDSLIISHHLRRPTGENVLQSLKAFTLGQMCCKFTEKKVTFSVLYLADFCRIECRVFFLSHLFSEFVFLPAFVCLLAK